MSYQSCNTKIHSCVVIDIIDLKFAFALVFISFFSLQVTDSYKQSKETVKNLLEVTSIIEPATFGIFK